jgi:short-subunit dehydrogenase
MHVVVTGASSGIGAAIARRFARANAKLTLVARRRSKLEELSEATGGDAHVVEHDLSLPERATEWIAGAEAAHGPIDVLVNNAGVQVLGRTSSVDVERGEMSLRLNVFTPLRLTRAVLPGMIERGHGTIVDVASMAAIAPTPCMTYYNASKGALAAASEALRGELRGTGVHVVTVYPGIIPGTDMGEHGLAAYESSRLLQLQPTGTTAVLADMIHWAVERKRPRVIYPRMNVLARWFPGTTRWFMDVFTPPLRD